MHIGYYVFPTHTGESVVVSSYLDKAFRESEIALILDEGDRGRQLFVIEFDGGELQSAELSDTDHPSLILDDDGFTACVPLNNINEAASMARFIQEKIDELADKQEAWT